MKIPNRTSMYMMFMGMDCPFAYFQVYVEEIMLFRLFVHEVTISKVNFRVHNWFFLVKVKMYFKITWKSTDKYDLVYNTVCTLCTHCRSIYYYRVELQCTFSPLYEFILLYRCCQKLVDLTKFTNLNLKEILD